MIKLRVLKVIAERNGLNGALESSRAYSCCYFLHFLFLMNIFLINVTFLPFAFYVINQPPHSLAFCFCFCFSISLGPLFFLTIFLLFNPPYSFLLQIIILSSITTIPFFINLVYISSLKKKGSIKLRPEKVRRSGKW